MAHFSTALWIDLSNGVLGGDVAAAMRRHLEQGCAACQNAYRRCTRQSPTVTVSLIFDSFREALPAGLRSGPRGSRHLLYQTNDVTADLRLEAGARTGRLLLIGQVADTRRPGASLGPLRVTVVRGSEELLSLGSNELGEFQCELDRGNDLMLSLSFDSGPVMVIPLDHLPAPSNPTADTYHPKATVNV